MRESPWIFPIMLSVPQNIVMNLNQWSGRLLSITGWDPSVCKSNWLHLDILRFSFIKLGYIYSINSSTMIGNFPAVLNFNRVFLERNLFFPIIAPGHDSSISCKVLMIAYQSFIQWNTWGGEVIALPPTITPEPVCCRNHFGKQALSMVSRLRWKKSSSRSSHFLLTRLDVNDLTKKTMLQQSIFRPETDTVHLL